MDGIFYKDDELTAVAYHELAFGRSMNLTNWQNEIRDGTKHLKVPDELFAGKETDFDLREIPDMPVFDEDNYYTRC